MIYPGPGIECPCRGMRGGHDRLERTSSRSRQYLLILHALAYWYLQAAGSRDAERRDDVFSLWTLRREKACRKAQRGWLKLRAGSEVICTTPLPTLESLGRSFPRLLAFSAHCEPE